MIETDEITLDRHYQQQLMLLGEISAYRCDKTDLAICETWRRVFDKAALSQKYARSCLMLLMCSQIEEVGRLGRPFTDMRSGTLDLNKILDDYDGDPMSDRRKGGECSPDELTTSQANEQPQLLPTTSQDNTSSNCTKKTYDSHENFRRLRLGNFSGSPEEWFKLQRCRQEQQEAVKMEKPCNSTHCESDECARRTLAPAGEPIYGYKELNFAEPAPILDIGSLQTVNIERQIGGTAAGPAIKEANGRQLQKKVSRDYLLKALAVHKIVSCDECCRERNCACIESELTDEPCAEAGVESVVVDREQPAETIESTPCALCTEEVACQSCELRRENGQLEEQLTVLRLREQVEAETHQRLQHLEARQLESCEKRFERLRSQIFNSSHKALRRLAEWQGAPEHMDFFLTVFDPLANDEGFKMQLTVRDRKFEELLQATLNQVLNQRAEQIKKEAKRFVREKYEKKRARAEKRLEMQLAMEQHHQQLNLLTNMILLKKLFLEECGDRIEQSDYVLKCLDEEFDKISKEA